MINSYNGNSSSPLVDVGVSLPKRLMTGKIEKLEKRTPLSRRVVSFLMAFLLFLGTAGQGVTIAHASGTEEASGGSIFDLVTNEGKIDESSDVAKENTDGSFKTVITKYKSIAVAIMGILTITMLIFMLFQFTKLGAAGDNDMSRKKAIMGILTTGIATALLGGATIIVGFFWGALTGS